MGQTLNSWQEIASYVGKGLRTVQRWEREIDFPVHRVDNDSRRVYSDTEEINQWMRRSEIATVPKVDVHSSIVARHEKLQTLRSEVIRIREQAVILRETIVKIQANRKACKGLREEVAVMAPGES